MRGREQSAWLMGGAWGNADPRSAGTPEGQHGSGPRLWQLADCGA